MGGITETALSKHDTIYSKETGVKDDVLSDGAEEEKAKKKTEF